LRSLFLLLVILTLAHAQAALELGYDSADKALEAFRTQLQEEDDKESASEYKRKAPPSSSEESSESDEKKKKKKKKKNKDKKGLASKKSKSVGVKPKAGAKPAS